MIYTSSGILNEAETPARYILKVMYLTRMDFELNLENRIRRVSSNLPIVVRGETSLTALSGRQD